MWSDGEARNNIPSPEARHSPPNWSEYLLDLQVIPSTFSRSISSLVPSPKNLLEIGYSTSDPGIILDGRGGNHNFTGMEWFVGKTSQIGDDLNYLGTFPPSKQCDGFFKPFSATPPFSVHNVSLRLHIKISPPPHLNITSMWRAHNLQYIYLLFIIICVQS